MVKSELELAPPISVRSKKVNTARTISGSERVRISREEYFESIVRLSSSSAASAVDVDVDVNVTSFSFTSASSLTIPSPLITTLAFVFVIGRPRRGRDCPCPLLKVRKSAFTSTFGAPLIVHSGISHHLIVIVLAFTFVFALAYPDAGGTCT